MEGYFDAKAVNVCLKAEHAPFLLADVELSHPLKTLFRPAPQYTKARLLVRLHGRSLGIVDLYLPESGLPASVLRDAIWELLSGPITDHLAEDTGDQILGIPLIGFGLNEYSACSWRALLRARPPPTAAIVINTCGGREHLLRTITTALGQDYDNFEVVVVDNRPSSSGVRALLDKHLAGERRVRYVAEHRPGLRRARNAGLYSTTAEIVAFTDDDVILDKSWLSWLVAGFTVIEGVACVTGLILPLELETTAQVRFEEFGGFTKGFERRIWDLDQHRLNHPLYPYTVGIFGSGASAAFRRSTLLKLGGFDACLGVGTPACGGEDLDIYTRTVLRGHRLVYEPAALLRHVHRREMRSLERQIWSYGVALGAMLTKHFLEDRHTRRELLRRLPAGLAYAFSPRSSKHANKSLEYPLRLTMYEFAGMVYGPIGYIRSRLSQ